MHRAKGARCLLRRRRQRETAEVIWPVDRMDMRTLSFSKKRQKGLSERIGAFIDQKKTNKPFNARGNAP